MMRRRSRRSSSGGRGANTAVDSNSAHARDMWWFSITLQSLYTLVWGGWGVGGGRRRETRREENALGFASATRERARKRSPLARQGRAWPWC